MNSVIQALYYTTRFRSLVLASTPGQNQPVLASLQQVFTFLRYSMRNIYSPSEFLRIARPPWFESGRQQDCSEFLTYLLDTLQEEERAAMPVVTEDTLESPAVTSYVREDITAMPVVTENTQESPPVMSFVLDDEDENMNSYACAEGRSDLKSQEDEIDKDQITEDEGEEARDVVKDTAGLEESLAVTSEKRLSRGSHGSLGLSRWSTEENLSMGDSREGLNTEGSKEMLTVSNPLAENDPNPAARSCLDSHSSSSDSGIQSVGSHTPEEDDSTTPVSLVHRMFGGRMETCYTCQTCHNTSMFRDWFTDLHLAIPQAPVTDSTTPPDNQKILAQKETVKRAFNEMNSSNSSQTKNTASDFFPTGIISAALTDSKNIPTDSTAAFNISEIFESSPITPSTNVSKDSTAAPDNQKILAQKETLKRAFNEMNSSNSRQSFDVDLISDKYDDDYSFNVFPTALITPSTNIPTENPSITITPPSTTLSVGDLVQHYLAPELLSGGNQYQCDNCNMLRDAVKTTRLSSAPDYLNITLLRFKYDKTTNRRAKVFTTIDYPQELVLPVAGGDVPYRLYSVVIHSGYSSDGGHYYTWCSNPATSAWLLLNDSQVSQATWGQFKEQTSKLSRDTAYLLFYERVGAQETGEEVVPHRPVMNKVIRDNMNYIREKENVGMRFQSSSSSGEFQFRRRDDRGDGDGSSSGCNDNFGQFGGGRCVF